MNKTGRTHTHIDTDGRIKTSEGKKEYEREREDGKKRTETDKERVRCARVKEWAERKNEKKRKGGW